MLISMILKWKVVLIKIGMSVCRWEVVFMWCFMCLSYLLGVLVVVILKVIFLRCDCE